MTATRSRDSMEHLLTSRASATSAARASSAYNYTPSIDSRLASDETLPVHNSQNGSSTYRGFPSREAYLEALEEFAEGKSYADAHDHTLTGFYGTKTMDHYKKKPKPTGDRAARKELARLAKRATVADGMPEGVPEEEGVTRTATAGSSKTVQKADVGPKESRTRRLSRVFTGRRATVT